MDFKKKLRVEKEQTHNKILIKTKKKLTTKFKIIKGNIKITTSRIINNDTKLKIKILFTQ